MKTLKKNKLKLVVIFIFVLSIFLITLSFVHAYLSVTAINGLAKYANTIDEKNNKILSAELFYEITKNRAKSFSNHFKTAAKAVEMLAELTLKQLVENNIVENKDVKINLTKYRGRNFFVDTTQQYFNIYYWGSESNVPPKIIDQLTSLKEISDVFMGMKNMFPESFYSIWVFSTNKFVFAYPKIENYYKDIKESIDFNKIYPEEVYPLSIKDKERKVLLPCIFEKPYLDHLGNATVGIKTAIYDEGKLVARVGVDLDLEKLTKAMLRVQLSKEHIEEIYYTENFSFLLGEKGNIIIFPQKYAGLFLLPRNDSDFNIFLDRDPINLSDSDSTEIKALAKSIIQNDSGTAEIQLNNIDYFVAYSELEETGWILCNVIRKDSLLSPTINTNEMIGFTVKKIFKQCLLITLTFLAISFIILFILFKYYVLAPIRRIRGGIKKMGDGNFNIDLKENGAVEFAELSKAFNYLGKELREYMRNLSKEVASRQSIETEVQLAENIQRTILPEALSFSANDSFQLVSRLNAAKNISGDFYDYFYITEKKIAFLIADVSGKGMQAAFFMAMSKVLIKNQCLLDPNNPAEVLKKVNQALCMDNKAQMFVTLCLVYYNIEDGSAIYVNAGHHSAAVLRDNNIKRVSKSNNIALGILDETEFIAATVKVNIEDTVILYTDGIPEAVSPEGDEYGEERLEKLMLKNKNMPLDDLCDAIMKDVIVFEGENRFDDITLIGFKRFK